MAIKLFFPNAIILPNSLVTIKKNSKKNHPEANRDNKHKKQRKFIGHQLRIWVILLALFYSYHLNG